MPLHPQNGAKTWTGNRNTTLHPQNGAKTWTGNKMFPIQRKKEVQYDKNLQNTGSVHWNDGLRSQFDGTDRYGKRNSKGEGS